LNFTGVELLKHFQTVSLTEKPRMNKAAVSLKETHIVGRMKVNREVTPMADARW
jgi:hypothetical protein